MVDEKIRTYNLKHVIDLAWCELQYAAGELNEVYYNNITTIVEHLEFVYPGHWELQIYDHGSTGYKLAVVIKFDEVVIKNSDDLHLIIRDLFVKIKFKFTINYADDDVDQTQPIRKLYISEILGNRGALTVAEHTSGYLHSHLPSNSGRLKEYNHFCLGSEGVSSTQVMLQAEWNNELFKMLLFQLEEFVAWESLDGGPYINMSSVFMKVETINRMPELPDIEDLYKKIDLELGIDDVEISMEDGYRVLETQTFNAALVRILPDKYKIYKGLNGALYPIISQSTLTNRKFSTNIIWRNKLLTDIHLTTDKLNNIEDFNTKYVHPNIVKLILQYLDTKLVDNLIKNNDI